jgi:hypothetical protein
VVVEHVYRAGIALPRRRSCIGVGSKVHGIGITFEPDGEGWTVGYTRGMGGGELATAYDLETAARAAERPLDELAQRLAANRPRRHAS